MKILLLAFSVAFQLSLYSISSAAENRVYGFGVREMSPEIPYEKETPNSALIVKDGVWFYSDLFYAPDLGKRAVLKYPKQGGQRCYKIPIDPSELRIKHSKCVTLTFEGKNTVNVTLTDTSIVIAAPKDSVSKVGEESFEEQVFRVRLNGKTCIAKLISHRMKYTGEEIRSIKDGEWGVGCRPFKLSEWNF